MSTCCGAWTWAINSGGEVVSEIPSAIQEESEQNLNGEKAG